MENILDPELEAYIKEHEAEINAGSAVNIVDNTDNLINERDQYLADNAPFATLQKEDEQEVMLEQKNQNTIDSDNAYRSSDLVKSGPPVEKYNYEQAYSQGNTFSADEDGGIELSNSAANPNKIDIAGFDMVTGENVTGQYQDEDGWISQALKSIKESKTNTVTGAPVEDSVPLAQLAYGMKIEGVEYDEFKNAATNNWTEDQKRLAWKASEGAYFREKYFPEMVKEAEGEAYPETQMEQSYAEQDLSSTPDWLEAVKGFYEYTEGAPYSGTDEELSDYGLWRMSMMNNMAYLSMLTARSVNGTDEFKKSMYDMMSIYENTDMSWSAFGRGVAAVASDPSTYMGIKLMASGATVAGKTVLKKILMKAGQTAKIGAMEGGAYMAADDAMRQTIEGEHTGESYDPVRGAVSTAVGVGAGALLGGVMGGAMSEPGVQFGKNLIRQAAKNWNTTRPPMMGTMRAQIGGINPEMFKAPSTAHTTRGRSIPELREVLPNEKRVTGKTPVEGQPIKMNDGAEFKSIDLDSPNSVKVTDDTINTAWAKAVNDSPEMASNKVVEFDMTPKDADFWSRALSLPNRARYWYEVSTEGMRDLLPTLSQKELSQFFNLVGATSPQADPNINIRRALSLLGHETSGSPANTAIAKKAGDKGGAVRKAFSGEDFDTNKIHNFTGTFEFLAGHSRSAPLSTNDRQVATSFGIQDKDLFSNQTLYEPVSRFYMNLRDELNAKLGPDEEPYQTWQLQAMGWVQERIDKNGRIEGDDYLMALDKVRDELVEAGVMRKGSKFTPEVLTHPKFQEVVDPTTQAFNDAKITTIEVMSELSPQTQRLMKLSNELNSDPIAQKRVNNALRKTMRQIINREGKNPSLASRVLSSITGKKQDITRIDIGQGTFEGAMNENMRIPLGEGLSDTHINQFLAVMGDGLKQNGTPASRYRAVNAGDVVAEGAVRTYSMFIHATDGVDAMNISKSLGHDVSVTHISNGTRIDIIPNFNDAGEMDGITLDTLNDAVKSFAPELAESISVMPVDFNSNYIDISETKSIISTISKSITDDAVAQMKEALPNESIKSIRKALTGAGDFQSYPASKRKRLKRIWSDRQRRISDASGQRAEFKRILARQEKEIGEVADRLAKNKGGKS